MAEDPSLVPKENENPIYTPVGTRRSFFTWVTGAIAAFIGVSLAVPLVGYVISPAFKRREQSWKRVGKIADLPLEEPKSLDYMDSLKDGWLETKIRKAVWAIKHSDNQVTVFSPICPHLGCGYRWNGPEKKFKCPCHGSVYNLSGKVIGGPAPRSLDVLPSRIENGELLVQYKQYKSGLDQQIEL